MVFCSINISFHLIAAGKSTFLRLLEEASPAYSIVSEPLTRWTNVPGDDQVGVAVGVAMTSSNHTPRISHVQAR